MLSLGGGVRLLCYFNLFAIMPDDSKTVLVTASITLTGKASNNKSGKLIRIYSYRGVERQEFREEMALGKAAGVDFLACLSQDATLVKCVG